ncbi:MAG: tyrosine phosphatase family protein [Aestuariivirga sp.]
MIIVCPLIHAQTQIDTHGASHVVSLLGPESPHRMFERVEAEKHLKLTFHDIAAPMPGFTAPSQETVHQILSFIRGWGREAPMVIHCWAGISRSTASAYMAQCLLHPHADETELAQDLRDASPSATPNALMIAYADHLLGRDGRMEKAIQSIGRGEDAYEGVPFVLRGR